MHGFALRLVRGCLPFVSAAVVLLAFFQADVRHASPPLTGDEPHYLALTDALTHGTLDVRAAYRDPSGPDRWLPGLPADQTVIHAGHVRSMRMPLLPLLLTPAMALGSLIVARLTILALGALLLDQLWRLLGTLGYRGRARAVAWLAVLTALPMLGYATHLYPEVPGALAVVVVLRLLARGSVRSLATASAVAGLLPWLIIRFGLLALGFVVAAVVVAVRPDGWRPREVVAALGRRGRVAAIVAAPGVASFVVFLAYLGVVYGSLDPRATYPPGYTQPWTPWHAYVEGIGSLVGAGEGFLPYAPAFLIALVGIGVAVHRYRAIGWFLLGVAAVHLLVVVPTGFWGAALPGRFVIVLVPLLAIALAEAVRVARVLAVAVLALVVLQLAVVGLYHDLNVLIVDRVPKHVYLAMFPPVDDEPGLPGFDLEVARNPGPVARADSGVVRADRESGAGLMYRSPALTLRPGRYRLGFLLLAAKGTPPDTEVARVAVVEMPSRRVLAQRSVLGRDAGRPTGLEFAAPGQPVLWPNRVVVEVDTTGVTELTLRSAAGRPVVPLRAADGVIHDGVTLAAAWLSAVAFGAGALLVYARRRTRSVHR